LHYFVILSDVIGMNNTTTQNLTKYFETFNKSLLANNALKEFTGGSTAEDKAEFTRLQRNAKRYHNELSRIFETFSQSDLAAYKAVQDAWNTFDSIFVKGK